MKGVSAVDCKLCTLIFRYGIQNTQHSGDLSHFHDSKRKRRYRYNLVSVSLALIDFPISDETGRDEAKSTPPG